jgi:hypothetical protein
VNRLQGAVEPLAERVRIEHNQCMTAPDGAPADAQRLDVLAERMSRPRPVAAPAQRPDREQAGRAR